MPDPQIQIPLPSGNTLYCVANSLTGQWFNTNTGAWEAKNPANWAQYVITLIEAVANSGVYFGTVPANLPAGTALLAVYAQSGNSPASTDEQYIDQVYALVYVLDWSGTAVNSIAPLNGGNRPQTQIPAQQNSLQKAQAMLDLWLAAETSMATAGYASVTIDGEQTVFRDPKSVTDKVEFWRNRVAILTGRRRRVQGIRMDQF